MFERVFLIGLIVAVASVVGDQKKVGISGLKSERNDNDKKNDSTTPVAVDDHRRRLKVIRIGTQEYANRATLVYAGGRCQTRNQSPQKQEFTARLVENYAAGRMRQGGDDGAEGGGGGGDADGRSNFEPVNIPTHFHVVSRDDADEPVIKQNQIEEQMSVMNAAFSRYGFSFTLVNTTFAFNTAWYYASQDSVHELEMKGQLREGYAATLNVYVTNAGNGVLGWATFPTDYETNAISDGVVVLDQSLPGGTASPYNEGVTLVHQVGHWLGLYHTFQGLGCYGSGDFVSDTSPVLRPNVGCPQFRDSCMFGNGTMDLVRNYMDYTDDSCMDSFTRGQVERMEALWMAYRHDDYDKDAAANTARSVRDGGDTKNRAYFLVLAFVFFVVVVVFVERLSKYQKEPV